MQTDPRFINALAVEMTILTGQVVTGETTGYCSDFLHFQDGGNIAVNSSDALRFHMYAYRPEGVTVGTHDSPEMHVSKARHTEEIARDIYRRLYPQALEWWQKCRGDEETHIARKITIGRALVYLAPYITGKRESDSGESAEFWCGHVRAQVYSDETVHRIEISSCTLDQAARIFAILQEVTG
jgi:hypothetical protein